MRLKAGKLVFIFLFSLFLPGRYAHAQAPLTISGISRLPGPIGAPVTITGLNFGASQATSTVSLNGTSATVTFWSDTNITRWSLRELHRDLLCEGQQ